MGWIAGRMCKTILNHQTYVIDTHTHIYIKVKVKFGFGGLVACWPLVPKFAGSNPTEAVGFFKAKKQSSARLPSEEK